MERLRTRKESLCDKMSLGFKLLSVLQSQHISEWTKKKKKKNNTQLGFQELIKACAALWETTSSFSGPENYPELGWYLGSGSNHLCAGHSNVIAAEPPLLVPKQEED